MRPITWLRCFGGAAGRAGSRAARARTPVPAANAGVSVSVCAELAAAGAEPRGAGARSTRSEDSMASADVGGAPKGCVRSPRSSARVRATRICPSTCARRRASCAALARARASRRRVARCGADARARIVARPCARRVLRRRKCSRVRQPRARRSATLSSSQVGSGAASSTICVRHHQPRASRSGSCATTPAACRSSSQRCTLLRCPRTNRARSGPPVGMAPQPITGANPTTSCSIEHANRPERAACPSRNR